MIKDRECPLFNKARDAFDEAVASVDPSQKLMNDMKETGLAMTKSAINTLEQMSIPMQVLNNLKCVFLNFLIHLFSSLLGYAE